MIEFGDFRLDPVERAVTGPDGASIQLTRRLYDTLLYMVERPGRLLEKQALLDAVWKGAIVEENTLSRTISTLRRILGDREGAARYIETVSGVGYRFVQPVTTRSPPAGAAKPPETSIAVLPFEDLSPERDQAYFADGIAEEVLDRLAGIGAIRVIAKSSSFRFRDRGGRAREVAQSLGVDYLLTGAVRKDGKRLRISARLIDAPNDRQIWSERFDREVAVESLFAIQDDIARAVANAFSARLGTAATLADPAALGAESSTRDLEAYDLYLRGKAALEQSGAPGTIRSVELFRAALARDPKFAAAWQALALAGTGRLIFAPEHASDAWRSVEEAVERTVALAPNWWAAHAARGLSEQLRRNWLAAGEALDRAAELAPGRPSPLDRLIGGFHGHVNDPDRAVEHFRAAARLEPLSLLVSGIYQIKLMVAGRNEEAESEYRRSLDLAGDREMCEHLVLHRLWARGAPLRAELADEFRARLRRYLDSTQTKPAPVLENVYAVCDDAARVLALLRAAAAAPEYQNPVRQLVLAWWLSAYGDGEAAFSCTWRGFVDLHYFNVGWLWWPIMASVRAHARFPELLERVGLTRYWRAKGREGWAA